jgi:hypothetical protein
MRWVAIAMLLPLSASVAQARPIDWQAELDHCRVARTSLHYCGRAKACLLLAPPPPCAVASGSSAEPPSAG